MVLPEYREGWDIVRGGGHRWKGLVGGDDAWDGIGAFVRLLLSAYLSAESNLELTAAFALHQPASSSYLALPRYPLDFSETAVIPIPKEARTLVIHADEGAQARVVFEMAAAGGAGLSIQSGSTESPSFVEQLGGEEDGVVGIVLVRVFHALVSVGLPESVSLIVFSFCCSPPAQRSLPPSPSIFPLHLSPSSLMEILPSMTPTFLLIASDTSPSRLLGPPVFEST
jgi:hypothetical protein